MPPGLFSNSSVASSDRSFDMFSTPDLEPDALFLRDLGLFLSLLEQEPCMRPLDNSPQGAAASSQLAALGPGLLIHALDNEMYGTAEVLHAHLQSERWAALAGLPARAAPLTLLQQDRLRTALDVVMSQRGGPPHRCVLRLSDWLFDMSMASWGGMGGGSSSGGTAFAASP